MSKFLPNREHSQIPLSFCFSLKKTAAESYRLLLEAHSEHAPSQDTYERWFRCFKSFNQWFAAKGIHKLPERWESVQQAMEYTLNKTLIVFPNLTYFLEKRNPLLIFAYLVFSSPLILS